MRTVLLGLVLALSASAQYVQSATGASSTAFAPGSLAVIQYFFSASTPPASATVSVLPAGAATPLNAQVVGVNAVNITFVVPPDAPAGDAELIFKPGNLPTQWLPITIVPSSFSLFLNGSGGPALAQNIASNGSPALNGLATPAQRGQAVVLWGTGLGTTPASAVQVTLGGVNQQVLYAGDAPGEPGLNQINIQIAEGTPDGCYLPLVVKYGAQSVTSFLSKTSDGLPCHHPFDLSVDAMRQLDSGAGLQTISIGLTTKIVAAAADRASRQESASVQIETLPASTLATFALTPAIPQQACSIGGVSASFVAAVIFSPGGSGYSLQNGTSTLNLPWNSPDAGDSPISKLPPAVLSGNWTLTGINPSFPFTLPAPVQLSDSVPVTIDRTQDRVVAWNGSAFDSTAVATVTLSAVTCTVPANAGSVTIPAKLLSGFTPGSAGVLSLSVKETGSGIPHVQVQQPGASELVLVNWTSTDARPVDFK